MNKKYDNIIKFPSGKQYAKPSIVIAPPDSKHTFKHDAIVHEEDSYLVLSAGTKLKDPEESPFKLIKQAHDANPETPGTVLVKGAFPFKFLAIIHDLDQDPSWKEKWISEALENIFRRSRELNICSLAIPLLGSVHGRFDKKQFVRLLRLYLERASAKNLKELWLIAPNGINHEIFQDLKDFKPDIQC